MSKYFVLALFIFVLGGCAPKHFVEKDMGSLTFFLQSPKANRVQLAVSFDHYALHDAQQNGSGVWQVKVPIHQELKYFYVVDSSVYIPECRFKETDDFGSVNCLYVY